MDVLVAKASVNWGFSMIFHCQGNHPYFGACIFLSYPSYMAAKLPTKMCARAPGWFRGRSHFDLGSGHIPATNPKEMPCCQHRGIIAHDVRRRSFITVSMLWSQGNSGTSHIFIWKNMVFLCFPMCFLCFPMTLEKPIDLHRLVTAWIPSNLDLGSLHNSHVCTCTCTWTCICICICICLCICVGVYACIYAYVYIHNMHIHLHSYVYIDTMLTMSAQRKKCRGYENENHI